MKKLRSTYHAVLISVLVISPLTGYKVNAANSVGVTNSTTSNLASPTANRTSSLDSIKLASNIKATLEEVNIWPQAGGNILTYTLNYSNGSNRNLNLIQYFSRVMTPTGTIIPGNPVTGDALKKKVLPKGTTRVTYYVNVGTTNSLIGLKIPMYVWDAKTKGYLKQVGTFNVPTQYTPTVASGKSLYTTMNDVPVTAFTESLKLYQYNGKTYAKAGISLTNRGTKVFEDPGYTVYLLSVGGTSFEMVLDSSQATYKIQPGEKKVIYYLTEIPPYLETTNMKLQYIQMDKTLKVELPKTSFSLPKATIPDLTVGKGIVKKILINNNTIETKLSNETVYAENNKGIWSFQLHLKNSGNKAVTMPSYALAIKSSEGKAFPIKAKSLNGISLNPLEEKVLQFTAELPLDVDQKPVHLELIEEIKADVLAADPTTESVGKSSKLTLPVAYFTIPYTHRPDTQQGSDYTTTNAYGTFSYKLHTLQRFPWKDDDIIVAKLSITNTQSTTLTLPNLKGALKIGEDDLTSSTDLFMDKQVATLASGKTIDMYVLTKIPYTSNIDKMQINLYSVANEENVSFLSLSSNNTVNDVDSIERGGSFMVAGKGKNAKVQEKKTIVYAGSNSNIVYTELLMSNEENRQSKMARLQAYYQTADGQFYEAISNQSDISAAPGGKQLIAFWTKIPKSVSTSNMMFYMGSGITGNKLSEPGQESTGVVNIGSLRLSPQSSYANMSEVTLSPYTLSIQSADGRIKEGSDSISIVMNYNLFKDSSYDTGIFNHKLILKMTDSYGQSQEKALVLGTDLTVGNQNRITMSFSSDQFKNLYGGYYRLTLYDEIQGERIELASQEYSLTYERLPEIEK
ncbi:hypothetical protein [Paenibacillus glacialis]|uniref:Uncharacterized protein n=1 Tax=Paenibacillus glacialis TaxID=494026 RepID=A0A168MLV9_9BACL|nr:hypothetical protein [Paenibacillus glacialis]OAB44825.1 hypothetical protein PGLA_05290 [Paenibacillus glacialis]